MDVLLCVGVAWHPSTDTLHMLSCQPVTPPCYITALCSTASTTSSTHALFLYLDRETIDNITVAGYSISWDPSAFYLLVLLEYQATSAALSALTNMFLYADSVLYKCHIVITDFSVRELVVTVMAHIVKLHWNIYQTAASPLLSSLDMTQHFRKWQLQNVLCVSKVFSELQCPAVLPQASMRLWSSVTMTKHATWAKVRRSPRFPL